MFSPQSVSGRSGMGSTKIGYLGTFQDQEQDRFWG